MQHFIKRIETGNRWYNFYFNLIHSVDGIRFHVSVVDSGKTTSLLMRQHENKWVMISKENCPPWILDVESRLSDAILENINS